MNRDLISTSSILYKVYLFFRSKKVCFCLAVVFLWGLLAHAYVFFQDSFSHDVLNALYADSVENIWKIQIGRFLVPVYRTLTRGALTLPWLIGLLSLLWIGLSLYLISQIFNTQSRFMLVLFGGILTTNICVSSLAATYIYELDIDMFAMLLSVYVVYLWKNANIKNLILGVILTASVLALYQSYLGVTIALILFFCILSLYKGTDYKSILTSGAKAVVMIFAGCILYYILLKIISFVSAIPYQSDAGHSFNLLSQISISSLLHGIFFAYKFYIRTIVFPQINASPFVRIFLSFTVIAPAIFIAVKELFQRKISLPSKVLIFLLALLIPIGSNISCLFTQGAFHDLMGYPIFLTQIFALLIIMQSINISKSVSPLQKQSKRITIVALCVFMWMNVLVSNSLYMKKDLEQEATLSLMTRVLYRMEEHEDYVPLETPVAFIGTSNLIQSAAGLDHFSNIVGAHISSAVKEGSLWYYNSYQAYLEYKLGYPAIMCDPDTWTMLETHPDVLQMPAYPAEDCMKMIDDVFVVKMGPVSP